LLVRLDREAFDWLAQEYPSLALRLASNVASLLQSKTRARSSTRDLKTISILPLIATDRTSTFSRSLTEQLDRFGDVPCLSAGNLGRHGAPAAAVKGGDEVSHALSHWLHDQEDRHRFVVFECAADEPAWTRFALRQSDLVLFVGDATKDPELGPAVEWVGGTSLGAIMAAVLASPCTIDEAIDISREATVWGTVTVSLADYDTGHATFDGLDGALEMDIVRLTAMPGISCQ
jgi:hypothetical protein